MYATTGKGIINTKDLNKDQVHVYVETPADSEGNQRLLALWWADNVGEYNNQEGFRGQYFVTNLEDHVTRWKEIKKNVVVNVTLCYNVR